MNSDISSELKRSLDLKYEYSIGGLRVVTNRLAEQGDVHTGTDGEVIVVFARDEMDFVDYSGMLGRSADREGWFPLVEIGGVLATGSRNGQIVLILEREKRTLDYDAFLRLVAAFASALQNRLVLHASAVLAGQGIAAFIGASGVGKSTIARRLNMLGFAPITDDLLPCRIIDQQVMVPLPAGSSALPRQLPIVRIYYLFRDPSLERMEIAALGKMKNMQLLLKNGFSELPLADVWNMQFSKYSDIADLVEAFQLTLPEGTVHFTETLDKLTGQPFLAGEKLHLPLSRAQVERTVS